MQLPDKLLLKNSQAADQVNKMPLPV